MTKFRPLKKAHRYGPLAGLCAGMSYATGAPAWIIRAIFIVALFFHWTGLIVYVVLFFTVSEWQPVPDDFEKVTGETWHV